MHNKFTTVNHYTGRDYAKEHESTWKAQEHFQIKNFAKYSKNFSLCSLINIWAYFKKYFSAGSLELIVPNNTLNITYLCLTEFLLSTIYLQSSNLAQIHIFYLTYSPYSNLQFACLLQQVEKIVINQYCLDVPIKSLNIYKWKLMAGHFP